MATPSRAFVGLREYPQRIRVSKMPKLPKGEAKRVFPIRLSDPERRAVEDAAKDAGLRASEWARSALLKAANEGC